MSKARQYYLLAILLALLFHGSLLPFTIGNTYDAYVHMFFGSHYAGGWFETWNYKWYTGFTMTSYPPLVHQIIALFSFAIGLKAGFILWCLIAVGLFIRGIFHFSQIWVSELAAGYACLIAVLSSSYIEAIHIFGQLPSITGMALLLNACPELYKWIRYNRWSYFLTGVSIIACLTAAHHVTTIFGMVFFIAPVLGVAVLDICIAEKGGIDKVRVQDFFRKVFRLMPKAVLIGTTIILNTVLIIFPYWYWSKTDPITQVSIPHGSRASFITEPSLGLVFFLIPWGLMLFFLPGIFQKVFHKRNLFLGISFALAFLLGTGGTTPLPQMILGENAFNILTLDRFTFWASIIAIPFMGQLMCSFVEGDLSITIVNKLGAALHRVIAISIVILMLLIAASVINFSNFKPLQPKPIDVDPIAAFMERDGHDRWRFMTLGFGDQMAWLSANTDALSLDGNYHSARRLPELTTRAVERIENAKYLGEDGLEALRDFISLPEKYNLKYVFSNDKFYESLLYFYGWKKLNPLENNLDVWERKDVPPLATVLPKKDIPVIQRLMWGLLPVSSLLVAIVLNFGFWLSRKKDRELLKPVIPQYSSGKKWYAIYLSWAALLLAGAIYFGFRYQASKNHQRSAEELVHAYFHALDFKHFQEAFSYLDDSTGLTQEQYLLELSLEDGIMASYAKLDSIAIHEKEIINDKNQIIKLEASWFTAVQKYSTQHEMELVSRKGKWYIIKAPYEKAIPPDQLINIPDISYHDQGRRKAVAGATFREDILDRPELYINEANLVRRDGQYHVVGSVTNVDNDPSFVTIEAVLYDKTGKELYRSNADEVLKHNLLPKESSAFRIDFDQWENKGDSISVDDVSDFVVFARTMVTDEKLYKFMGLRNLEVSATGKLIGSYDNYGNKEISIPQIIIQKRQGENIVWAESCYIDRGIRPQREKPFSINLEFRSDILIRSKGSDDNLLINGTKRSQTRNLLPTDSYTQHTPSLSYKEYDIELFTNGLISH